MIRSITTRILFSVASLLSAVFSMAQFNSNVTLKIGDPAPPFKVQEWVRGAPYAQFEKGKVYVLDFWATWCGGCIASFPHISAIAEKYKGKVTFTSVDVYENIDSSTSNVDPVAKVKTFLKTPRGQKLTFGVAVDGNSKTMWNSWIATIRRTGVPTTYVIDQQGRVAWVDVNLDHLDWVLQQVLAGTWDIQKAAAVMQQKDALEDKMFANFRKGEGDHKEDWQEVLADAQAFEQQFPDRTDAVAFSKFMALAEVDKEKVPALLEKMAANPLTRYINMGDAAGLTLRRKDLTKADYTAIAKAQERLLQNPYPGTGHGGKSVKAYEELADTYFKAGNTAKAAASMEKAIALATKQKAKPDQVKKMQGLLLKYKSTTGDK